MSAQSQALRLTTRNIRAMKGRGESIAMLTAYDSVTAALLDEVGIDILLVGDSLGNVVLGYETTLRVTLADMIRHAGAVSRGSSRAFVVCDMPFGTATDPETALRNAVEVMQQSDVQAVKVEGGMAMVPIVQRLTSFGIPVMGHLGLTPQSVHQLGGYYMHGKNASDAQVLLEAAQALEQAGAFAVVLECLVPELASTITRSISIPTIGIGSGAECDGQVLVINDLIGLNTRPAPSFARPRADIASTIKSAARAYLDDVKAARSTGISS